MWSEILKAAAFPALVLALNVVFGRFSAWRRRKHSTIDNWNKKRGRW